MEGLWHHIFITIAAFALTGLVAIRGGRFLRPNELALAGVNVAATAVYCFFFRYDWFHGDAPPDAIVIAGVSSGAFTVLMIILFGLRMARLRRSRAI